MLGMIENLPQKEREEDPDYYGKMQARAFFKRGAANAWLAQFDSAIDDLHEAMKHKQVFSDVERNNIEADIATIKKRKESQEIKLQGDIFFARNLLDDSLKAYERAIDLDPLNEYALSNISVIHLKRQNYNKCLEYTIKALTIIEEFQSDTREFNRDCMLEVKLLQRRAKCYEMSEDWEKAKVDLDRALMLDKQNAAVVAAQKKVQDKLNTMKFDEFKEQGNKYLQSKEFAAALEYYEKCLRITRKATTLDNISIYVNKIACLLSLEKHSQVVLECNDAQRLIKNYLNRNQKMTGEDSKRVKTMQLRVSVRRAAALAKLNKVTDAIEEYEKALQLDPSNATLKKELDVLRKVS